MKNRIAVIAVSTMLVLSLAGCGTAHFGESGTSSGPAVEPIPELAAENGQGAVEGAAAESAPAADPAAVPAAGPAAGTAEEQNPGQSLEQGQAQSQSQGQANAQSQSQAQSKALTDEQAVAAVRAYCCEANPDLAEIAEAGEYPVYWDVSDSNAQQVVVVFRSYTGSVNRYYIDRASGEAYVTEFVPGITDDETRTDETLNVWEYVR